MVYRLLRAEGDCRGGVEQGASACPLVRMVLCVCGHRWHADDVAAPGPCPSCDQYAAEVVRCESCPAVEVDYYRENTSTGQFLNRVLEHDFDCKHYHLETPGDVSRAETREGLKVLEYQEPAAVGKRNRGKRRSRNASERQRVRDMQRRGR